MTFHTGDLFTVRRWVPSLKEGALPIIVIRSAYDRLLSQLKINVCRKPKNDGYNLKKNASTDSLFNIIQNITRAE